MEETEFGSQSVALSDKSKNRLDTDAEKDAESEDSAASEKGPNSLITKALKENEKLQEAWVQCEKPDCLKWRSISKAEVSALGDEPWFCYMNEDLRYSSCDVPEEDTCQAEEMAERCRLIYIRSILPVGSLVWAKMPGYCWWPGMVVVDVDYDMSVSVDADGDPLSYHVEFLGPKRSHAWIPEHMVEIYGDHVPYDPSAGRKEKTTGLEKTIYKGVSVKEAVKEANSFQMLTTNERLSRSHFLPSVQVMASSKPGREDRKKKKRQASGSDLSKDKTVPCKTKRSDEEINSQDEVKKKKNKAELATGTKILKKGPAKEKSLSADEPVSQIQQLIPEQKTKKLHAKSTDQVSLKQKTLSGQKSKTKATASTKNEHHSSSTKSDVEVSDLHDSRVVPDVEGVVPDVEGVVPDVEGVVPDVEGVQEQATEDSVLTQKVDATQKSKLKAGKPSFTVPSIGSSRPLENKANQGAKKGFCPPVKTKDLEKSSAETLIQTKPKATAAKRAINAAIIEDETAETGGSNCQSNSEEVNKAEPSGDEKASAFDELADEICSVGEEKEEPVSKKSLQKLLGQSVSLIGRTKEEKYTIDVQMYKENHDRFEQDVCKFMSQNKQRVHKLPVWENRSIGLFELFLATHDRGGYDKVCQKRLWTEIYSELTGVCTAKPNPKTKNYYKKYLLPYELYIHGREYGHLFTKNEAGKETEKAKKPRKSDKANIKHSKKSEAKEQKIADMQPEDDAESESAELEELMLDLKEYDTLCQSQVSACLQHELSSDTPTASQKKLISTPVKIANKDDFLCDMEEEDLLNDGVHVVPLACTMSPVFSSDREDSRELQEMEALKHELVSIQQHLDEMNSSVL